MLKISLIFFLQISYNFCLARRIASSVKNATDFCTMLCLVKVFLAKARKNNTSFNITPVIIDGSFSARVALPYCIMDTHRRGTRLLATTLMIKKMVCVMSFCASHTNLISHGTCNASNITRAYIYIIDP